MGFGLVDRKNLVPTDEGWLWLRSYEFLAQKPARFPAVLNPARKTVLFDDGRFELLALAD
jgi:hypothetical protein